MRAFLFVLVTESYDAFLRRTQPNAPSAEPNNHTAAGTGTALMFASDM